MNLMRTVKAQLFAAALFASMVFVLPFSAQAQSSPTGTLTGAVMDPSGGVLPGVTVTAKGQETGLTQQTVTGETGQWRIPALPVGTYEVSFAGMCSTCSTP